MTNFSNNELCLGYAYDDFYNCNIRTKIVANTSINNNSHTLICGMSGSGKSTFLNQYLAKLCLLDKESIIFFGDYKSDDTYEYLRQTPRYFPYKKTLEALDIIYNILLQRQVGKDRSRIEITFIWEEYVANVLALSKDKKKIDEVMSKVAEILMLGRSLGIRLIIATQRPDANVFPNGSRLNFGIIIILGAFMESIYSMLMPKELVDKVGNRSFCIGEGSILLQGSDLKFIKIPVIKNEDKMKEICIEGLTR